MARIDPEIEFITIAREWQRWPDPRLTIMVMNNGDLNMVSWEQRVMSGDPKFRGSQDLPSFPYADYARMLGLDGIRVDRPGEIALPGMRLSRARGRRCLRWSPIRTSRQCHRTSPPSRQVPMRGRCSRAIRMPSPRLCRRPRSGGLRCGIEAHGSHSCYASAFGKDPLSPGDDVGRVQWLEADARAFGEPVACRRVVQARRGGFK